MPYDVGELRKRMQQQVGGKQSDPDEFRPKKAESTTEAILYRFYILPYFMAGETIKGGVAEKGMSNFYIQHGAHWLNNKQYQCPRIWDGTRCDICNIGFDLLREEKDENKRKAILSTWMPSTYYMVNIYFPAIDVNPEELRGRVKFFNAPKTCFDQWQAALMRENMGRDDDPKAYGAFFDENAAFMFQLEVLKHGKNNSYKTSKFIANGGKPSPMFVGADGKAHPEGIAKLLALRNNLWNKVRVPDINEIQRIAKSMLDGDDANAAPTNNFDKEDTVVAESKPQQTSPKTSSPKASAPDVLSNEVPLDEVVDTPVTTAAKSTAAVGGAGVGTDEIDALLQQLGEE